MKNPFDVVRDFEKELCLYTGAKYAVTTTSCTMALLLACKWNLDRLKRMTGVPLSVLVMTIPKKTYVSVPMSIIHAGGKVRFDKRKWLGMYQLKPYPIWDSARLITSGMYKKGQYQCLSFHWSKQLGIQQGGVILHDDPIADKWFRKMRFDGRTEGVKPKEDNFDVIGYHAYMSPEVAAEGLMRLSLLPKHNKPLPNDDYPSLDKYDIFK